jgi:hypothetical protein
MKLNYWDLLKRNVVDWMQPLIENRAYSCRRADGKFVIGPTMESTNSPWHHIEYSGSCCPYLHSHLFQVISPRTPIGQFVPRACQACWKVVIRPRTLTELLRLEELLLFLEFPTKCGIERRSYAPCSRYRYGGYIYNRSQEEGLERLGIIREYLSEDDILNGVEAYLKRACTEMELTFPDSSSWKVSKEQNDIEDMLDWLVVYDIEASHVSKHVLDSVRVTWIEWAAEIGDETYLEYTDGKPIYTPAMRYERGVEGTEAGSPDDETVSFSPTAGEVPKGMAQRTTEENE